MDTVQLCKIFWRVIEGPVRKNVVARSQHAQVCPCGKYNHLVIPNKTETLLSVGYEVTLGFSQIGESLFERFWEAVEFLASVIANTI